MKSYRKELHFHLPARRGIVSITPQVEQALRESGMVPYLAEGDYFAFLRMGHRNKLLVAVNRSAGERELEIPSDWSQIKALLGPSPVNGRIHLGPYGYSLVLSEEDPEKEEA